MKDEKPYILLIGGGGHCRSVIDVIECEGEFNIAGVIDREEFIGRSVLGYKVIGSDNDMAKLREKYDYALITIGQIKSSSPRERLFNLALEIGFILPVVVSPRAYVSRHSSIDEGSVIMHDAAVNAGARVGNNCIINTKSLIEHDVQVGDNCHVSTGAIVNGDCVVENSSFIGSGAVSKESVRISGFVRAGSLFK